MKNSNNIFDAKFSRVIRSKLRSYSVEYDPSDWAKMQELLRKNPVVPTEKIEEKNSTFSVQTLLLTAFLVLLFLSSSFGIYRYIESAWVDEYHKTSNTLSLSNIYLPHTLSRTSLNLKEKKSVQSSNNFINSIFADSKSNIATYTKSSMRTPFTYISANPKSKVVTYEETITPSSLAISEKGETLTEEINSNIPLIKLNAAVEEVIAYDSYPGSLERISSEGAQGNKFSQKWSFVLLQGFQGYNIIEKEEWKPYTNTVYKFSAFAQRNITKNFGIYSGIEFTPMKYSYDEVHYFNLQFANSRKFVKEDIYIRTLSYLSVEIPLGVHFTLLKKAQNSIYVEAGLNTHFQFNWKSSEIEESRMVATDDLDLQNPEKTKVSTRIMNLWDGNISPAQTTTLAFGYQYQFSRKFSFETRTFFRLPNYSSDRFPAYKAYGIQLGIRY